MSFCYNPYNHIEIIRLEDGSLEVHCHSCGADKPLGQSDSITKAFDVMAAHLMFSHERPPESFAGWSIH